MSVQQLFYTMRQLVYLLTVGVFFIQLGYAQPLQIKNTEKICVEAPLGTAPRLPWQVWVEYSDGSAGYRQVKWTNSARSVEEEQAAYPLGKEYEVMGYILGDNTTDWGYRVEARVKVVEFSGEASSVVAEPFPLNKVRLIGTNRLTSNRDRAIQEICSWDVAQQLYNYRDTYGLSTEGYPKSNGWDSPTTKLKGHGSGHYMSALAQAFASATRDDQKSILRANMARMVNELRQCQERTFMWNDSLGRYWEARDFAPEAELREMKGSWSDFDLHKSQWQRYGYGYLNAIPAHHAVLIEMYRPYNNEQWVWAPYYSIHKQLAGLIDIATYIDDKRIAAKALLIAKDMGLWIWNRLHYRTFVQPEGSREERRAQPGNRYEMWNMYIAGEDGGTGESLARLSEMVDKPDEKARLLEASTYFDSPAFYEPLSNNIDDIRTRHANQHIPKIISALRTYRKNNNPFYYQLSRNFWEMIQGRYRYSSGGVGNGEMFRQPYTQMLSMATNHHPTLNETCCAYNLAKLTRDLVSFNPDDARYMDYYERLLYNQLVGSLHPTHYLTTYHYAVGLNASKPWGNRTPQESCCGGTGSENHVKYQDAAYFASDNTLWVALYLPTELMWDAKNIGIEQNCEWPAEKSTIRIKKGKARFAMKLRVPAWATRGFEVKLNGVSVSDRYQPGTYVTIPERRWTSKDVVEVVMPFTKYLDFGPDKQEIAFAGNDQPMVHLEPEWAATVMYGPMAMTATGVERWDEATLVLDSRLDSIVVNEPTPIRQAVEGRNPDSRLDSIRLNSRLSGTEPVHTLTVGGRTFEPDYYRSEHSTHYFRIKYSDDEIRKSGHPGISALAELLVLAESRINEQEAWNSLTVKIPEHAPWAPQGYARMKAAYDNVKQGGAPSALSAALTTMRPGNLAEPEDLALLTQLVERAGKIEHPSPALTEAIAYARMVINYVKDGSGTKDMIEKAIEKLGNR